MCTVFLLFNHLPDFPIALVANRDEMHDRPTSILQGWDATLKKSGMEIYAPRDDLHGGTWFGFSPKNQARYAVLTNIRDPKNKKQTTRSRGEIIPHFLNSQLSPRQFVSVLKENVHHYNGFNLIFGNEKECFYFHSKTCEAQILWQASQKKEKIFGLSNGKINSNWPKVQNTKQFILKNQPLNSQPHWQHFKEIMQNKNKYPLAILPITGVPSEIEVFLSSLFIQHEIYGTRSTLYFALNLKEKKAQLCEQNYSPAGLEEQEVCFLLT